MDVLVAGEALVDFIPDAYGPLADVESFTRRAGGAPANVAVGLARLDRPPAFWTRVGEDPFGDHLVATLSDSGVRTDLVERDPDARTGLAFVAQDADADRSFTFYRDGSADTRLSPENLPASTVDAVEWVHVGGVTLADEPARSATIELVSRAAGAGCTVSFDPNARPELWDEFDYASSVRTMLPKVDVLVSTVEELEATGFEGGTPRVVALAASEAGPHTVLLTRGESGALAVATGNAPWAGEADHPGYPVDPVDTTGAGDAFTAGAIDRLLAGDSLGEALAFANAVAAVATTGPGAVAALPHRDAVEAFREAR